MKAPLPSGIEDDAAETAALEAAVAEARANRRGVSHEERRARLMKIATGDQEASPPVSHSL